VHTLKRDQVAAVYRVAEKDSRVELGNDRPDTGGVQGDRRVLTGRTTAQVLARDDDLVRGYKFVVRVERNMSLGQSRLGMRDTAQGVLAELPIFFRNGRVRGQVLGRDNLVRIDVVAQHIGLADDGFFHGEGV